MGKRSDFKRIARDYYPTPREAVVPLSRFIQNIEGFCEPCVGNGALAYVLMELGHECVLACDLEPVGEAWDLPRVIQADALELTKDFCHGFSHFITNPPWPAARGRGQPTLDLIRHLSALRPTWMLLSSDFAHNVYAKEVMNYCELIVSIGRVKWIEDSEHMGKENAAWYLFDQDMLGETVFIPRREPIMFMAAHMEELL